ncbi:MAG: hypothetical protein RI894_19, partial [Bacteroidota bacterium]
YYKKTLFSSLVRHKIKNLLKCIFYNLKGIKEEIDKPIKRKIEQHLTHLMALRLATL